MQVNSRWLFLLIPALCCAGCASSDNASLEAQVSGVLTQIQQLNPDLQSQMDHSYGCAVFPAILKGAAGIDIAYGRGIVYQHHRQIGQAAALQYTLGAAIGGQSYWQVILFPEKTDLDDFRENPTVVVVNASVIALHSGGGGSVAVPAASSSVVQPLTGLMLEVALGGETVWFKSLKKDQWNYSALPSPRLASR